ncbi:MAG: NAD(+) diphosphatase [Myxococcaceae bacterium]|nr:NAD(+) diphosphatase [Myxococcaceae bacterium]MCI0673104.1 NAD(+) diphosphatase [Myxococcaceae bacterium]
MPQPRFVPGLVAPAIPAPGAHVLLVQGLDVLVEERDGAVLLPSLADLAPLAEGLHLLGTLDGRECYAAALARSAEPPSGMRLVPARSLHGQVEDPVFAVAARALAVAEWDVMHRFCGRCGQPTGLVPSERARRCAACESVFYPRISPAVIVLIERGEEVLLARSGSFPRPFFSAIAGFVEPGESLEDAAAREVREEVGVEISHLRYFSSQPWPFGRSLMVGFTARWAGGEVRADGQEIVEAGWFTSDALPQLTPSRLSIARHLIDDFVARRRGGG